MTLLALPVCRHRGEEVLPGRWLCNSPRLVLPTGLVSAETCRSRCPYVDHAIDPDAPQSNVASANSPRRGGHFEWVSTARLVADSVILAGLLPLDCSGVAGIPRSGMLPATVVATHLHLPLYELTGAGQLHRLDHGSRGHNLGFSCESPRARPGPLAVVDDTVYGGTAMQTARRNLMRRGRQAVFAAVYVRPEAAGIVDVFARLLPCPHLLEWNIVNNGPFAGWAANLAFQAGIALDLDGVIVHDAHSGGRPGSPYLVPRTLPCRLIATGRPERHRAQTESLLRRAGARWERLEMLPDGMLDTAESIAQHKARHYAQSGCGFFLESDPVQAELIFRLAGKPTVCPRAAQVWHVPLQNGASENAPRTEQLQI